MRGIGKALGRILLGLLIAAGALVAALVGALWLFGPREPVVLSADFDPRKFGEGVQVYFESIESAFDDITPGVEKRVIWADGFKERRTPVSVVYIHGFTATSQEIRPVPDRVAQALGANLVFTRLAGHGRPGDALGRVTAIDWVEDTAEALAAGRAVGEKVVVIATSTGGTLAALAALDPAMSDRVAAMILISPNFGPNEVAAGLLSWPGARWWLPWVIGDRRSYTPASEAIGRYWTTDYPSVAVLPMAALVSETVAQDFSGARVPALFWFTEEDQVVRPEMTHQVANAWGGRVSMEVVRMGPGDDPSSHVIAGDLVSPGQTDAAVAGMLDWLRSEGIGG
ncbi:Thermostable monoacylglycerol lipase [Marinibacterium anthonyi]|nr:Thermostable monoacylglycerol lipase [Marinibacterium anthonyi]